MKISEIIEFYQKAQKILGDVEIHEQESDGRATWSSPYTPKRIVKEKIWDSHPAPARYYVKTY